MNLLRKLAVISQVTLQLSSVLTTLNCVSSAVGPQAVERTCSDAVSGLPGKNHCSFLQCLRGQKHAAKGNGRFTKFTHRHSDIPLLCSFSRLF